MAWGDLASNQMVSYADATGGGFTIKPGKTNPGTLQCMTKAQAFDMYYLQTTTNTNTVASNQLMRKDYWVASSYYVITSTTGAAVAADACSLPGTVGFINTFYVQISTNRVFTDSGLTNPLIGFNYWFVFDDLSVPQIDNSGYIIGYYYGCIF